MVQHQACLLLHCLSIDSLGSSLCAHQQAHEDLTALQLIFVVLEEHSKGLLRQTFSTQVVRKGCRRAILVDLGSIWGRFWVDLGSPGGRFRRALA